MSGFDGLQLFNPSGHAESQMAKTGAYTYQSTETAKTPDLAAADHNACSIVEYTKTKFYEYVAMAEILAILAGMRGKEKQDEALNKLGAVFTDEEGFFYNFFSGVGALQMRKGYELQTITADESKQKELEKKINEAEEARKKHTSKAFNILKEWAKGLWDSFTEMISKCGVLHAVRVALVEGAFFVGEAAIGAGAAKAIKTAFVFVARAVDAAGKGVKEVTASIRAKSHIPDHNGNKVPEFEQTFSREHLEKEWGKPEDNHVGAKLTDENRPTTNGKKEKLTSGAIGTAAEKAAAKRLKDQGYDEVVSIQNNSGHGIDLVGHNSATGKMKVIEVKANSARLSPAQRTGGEDYFKNRISRAERGRGHWSNVPEGTDDSIRKLKKWLEQGGEIDYEVWRFKVSEDGIATFNKSTKWEKINNIEGSTEPWRSGGG